MGLIRFVTKEAKEERKANEDRIIAEVIALKGAIQHFRSSNFDFVIDPVADVAAPDPPATDLP